jgi:hypothetical protein
MAVTAPAYSAVVEKDAPSIGMLDLKLFTKRITTKNPSPILIDNGFVAVMTSLI